ncbi:MAG: hypothetical protein JXR60_08775 [Bacteroidales bacterium]|nr:hypothetical protein [Bacteroidales bacterium]
MGQTVKKIASYLLIGIVILVTGVSILAIWDVINLERVFWKTTQSLFVVFIASVVILFITSVIINNDKKQER